MQLRNIRSFLLHTTSISSIRIRSSASFLLARNNNNNNNYNIPKIFNNHRNTNLIQMTASSSTTDNNKEDTTPTFQLSPRLNGLSAPTVWHEFSPLSVVHKSINLGQGFPDWDPPRFAIEALSASTNPSLGTSFRSANQYARSYAHMPLANVLAEDYSKRFGREICPESEVATAVGCTNALYCAFTGLVGEGCGDEVVLLEPAFDVYIAQAKMAGATVKFVPLRTKHVTDDGHDATELRANDFFRLDYDELDRAITPKTKVFVLNTPHNPTGKMFDREELEKIAEIVKRHPQLTVIADEVYEHIVFDGEKSPHVSIATLPGMWERTLTLSSSGKTFSATGWKVGWAIGPPHLTKAVTAVQQWVNFSAPTPNQDAIAQALIVARQPYVQSNDDNDDDTKDTTTTYPTFYAYVASEYKRKRSLLCAALRTAGMTPIIPDGGFFVMADTRGITYPAEYDAVVTEAMPTNPMPRDWAMSRWMTEVVGVTAIPPSAFYGKDNVGLAKNLLRFAYCKGDGTILEAHERFRRFFKKEGGKEGEENSGGANEEPEVKRSRV